MFSVKKLGPMSGLRAMAAMPQMARLSWRLLRDRRVPLHVKAIPILAVVYILSPVDLLPEALVGPLGLTDDLAILLMALRAFVKMVPEEIVAAHGGPVGEDDGAGGKNGGKVIEAEYRSVDD